MDAGKRTSEYDLLDSDALADLIRTTGEDEMLTIEILWEEGGEGRDRKGDGCVGRGIQPEAGQSHAEAVRRRNRSTARSS